jgi:cell growth-regulating nucleolar protein
MRFPSLIPPLSNGPTVSISPPRADEYRSHTSCISEAERYEKSVFRGVRKGEAGPRKKMSAQEAWTLLIADGVGTAPPAIRPNLERLAMLDNVPRKEKQFRNFAANSLSMRRSEAEEMAGEIWKHLSQLREEQKKANEDGRKKQEAEAEAKASKAEAVKEEAKRGEGVEGSSSSSSSSESSEGGDSRSESRRVSIAMTKLLKEAPRKKMKVSKLGKKVKKELLLKRKKKEMKVLLKQIIAASKSGMKIDGKRVILID